MFKGYARKFSIDFNFLMLCEWAIFGRVGYGFCTWFEAWAIICQITFLHGNLDEKIDTTQIIDTTQVKVFVEKDKENLVCQLTKSLYRLI